MIKKNMLEHILWVDIFSTFSERDDIQYMRTALRQMSTNVATPHPNNALFHYEFQFMLP